MKCSICGSNLYSEEEFRKGEHILHIELSDSDRPFLLGLPLLFALMFFFNAHYEWALTRTDSILVGVMFLSIFIIGLFVGESPDIKHFHSIDELEETYPEKPDRIKIKKARVAGNWQSEKA